MDHFTILSEIFRYCPYTNGYFKFEPEGSRFQAAFTSTQIAEKSQYRCL